MVRSTLFWAWPKGLRYSVSPPASLLPPFLPPFFPHCSPVPPSASPSAWGTREKTKTLGSLFLALFIKDKLIWETGTGHQQQWESLKIILITAVVTNAYELDAWGVSDN